MLITNALLALPLLLVAATPSAAQTMNGPSVGSSAPSVPHGPLDGTWRLPNPMRAGGMTGVLRDKEGRPVIKIAARITRDVTAPSTGSLAGQAEFLVGPRAGEKLAFHGRWEADARGEGTFRGKLLGKARNGQKPRVLVRLHGGYRDGTSSGTGGKFKGRWHAAKKK